MNIALYRNNSEPNKINKNITALNLNMSGSLRNESEVVNPIIRIEGNITSLQSANYAYIEAFSRYYYITEMKSVRNNIVELHLHADVLMSFNISAVSGVVVESENIGSDYLQGRQFVRLVKSKTDILPFSGGLLDSGEYILITAGGGG